MKIGFTEILVVFIVALLVIGPDKLPEAARKLGAALKSFREATGGITKELRENVVEPLNEAQAPLREALAPITELKEEIDRDVQGLTQEVNQLGRSLDPAAPKTAAETTEAATEKIAELTDEPKVIATAGEAAPKESTIPESGEPDTVSAPAAPETENAPETVEAAAEAAAAEADI